MKRSVVVSAALTALLLGGVPTLAQESKAPAKADKQAPKARTYLDQALATGASTGVAYADSSAPIEGPKTIAGAKSYESPLPFFKDLKPWDPNYKPPRTPDGHPDLQGVWSTASLTTMSRNGSGDKVSDSLVIPDEKIAEVTRNAAYSKAAADSQKRTDPNAGVFTDKNAEAGYNAFWIDPGSEYAKVNTEWRSSWITSPANGQVPFSKAALTLRGQRMTNFRKINNTGPEIRPLGERCFMSFGSQGGPPLNNAMYNNNLQIVQTRDNLMIDVEMNHDARIIRIDNPSTPEAAMPGAVKRWFGDSIAHWEGDTLVVVTRNFNPTQLQVGAFPVSDQGQVTEWFKRVSDQIIDYKFKVEDPVYYTESWTGEIPLRKSKEVLYEYACHEGNYALPGILRADAQGRDTAISSEGE
ncbi:MAG: hypothetical protein GC155_13555 [Alphaproteobacteria bacterium]|nr:hypothetical protein [Alphaproteobacteria bacterium]